MTEKYKKKNFSLPTKGGGRVSLPLWGRDGVRTLPYAAPGGNPALRIELL